MPGARYPEATFWASEAAFRGQSLKGAQCLSAVQPFTFYKTLLPVVAFELGIEMFFLRITGAKIGDKLPACGHSEHAADYLRVKDRNPSDADALRPRREPKSMNRG